MVETVYPSLAEIEQGDRAIVRRVRDSDSSLLRHLREVGIRPEAVVEVVGRSEHEGPIALRVGDRIVHLGKRAAAGIFVEVITQ